MKKLLVTLAAVMTASLFAAPATELVKLSGPQAVKRAHGPGTWVDNATGKAAAPELKLSCRLWYNDESFCICLKDAAKTADDKGNWEVLCTQYNNKGDLLCLTVGPGAKLSAKSIVRMPGGEATKKFTELPADFGKAEVTVADGVRTILVTIPIKNAQPFGVVSGTVCFMNFFYFTEGKTIAWRPTGSQSRLAPWFLCRVEVLK